MWNAGKTGDVEMSEHMGRGYSDSNQFNGDHGGEDGGASAHEFMLAQNKLDEEHQLPGNQQSDISPGGSLMHHTA